MREPHPIHEIRKDPLLGRWVIIASERTKRPTDFQPRREEPVGGVCPFCQGSEEHTPPEVFAVAPPERIANAPGWRVRVVPNKFPALGTPGELDERRDGMYERMRAVGAHEVIIESPDHATQIADLSEDQVSEVVAAYVQRVAALSRDPYLRYILVFKNHGADAGATLEHAHTQIIATPVVPKRVVEEIEGAERHFRAHQRCVFCDMIEQETTAAARVVDRNADHLAFMPFAARFPFETWILPRPHAARFEELEPDAIRSFAAILRGTLRRMNRVLDKPAFNYVLHTAPSGPDVQTASYHWHLEIIPKLTKMAGFEWGSGFYINPVPPEYAAEQLREIQTF